MSDDAYESVLLVVKECMVYRIPPRANSRGYRASDWDVNQFLWKGRLRVVAKGDDLFIKLEDSTTGELFAQCPYNMDGTSVEPVLDSSRYFVLTIVDIASGKHAFIGMGFPERSWAFDFNVAIQDQLVKNKNAPKFTGAIKGAPPPDFSLKEDQKIVINIGGMGGKKKAKQDGTTENAASVLLPPPPASKLAFTLPPPPSTNATPTTAHVASSESYDPFLAISQSHREQPTMPPKPPSTANLNSSISQEADDGWANFGDFVGANETGQDGWTKFE